MTTIEHYNWLSIHDNARKAIEANKHEHMKRLNWKRQREIQPEWSTTIYIRWMLLELSKTGTTRKSNAMQASNDAWSWLSMYTNNKKYNGNNIVAMKMTIGTILD